MGGSFLPPVGLEGAAEKPDGGLYVLGLVLEENESSEGGEMFILIQIIDSFAECAAKNVNRGAQCKGMDRVCEFGHGSFLSWVVSTGSHLPGRDCRKSPAWRLGGRVANGAGLLSPEPGAALPLLVAGLILFRRGRLKLAEKLTTQRREETSLRSD